MRTQPNRYQKTRDWIVYYLNGKEVCAYTAAETFPGEQENTISLLALEYNVGEEQIVVCRERRTR